jgi:hypothetical protein
MSAGTVLAIALRPMTWSFLESALALACPSFREEWTRLRRTYTPERPPSATEFLGALRAHVVQLLDAGRAAESVRLFLALERLLGEADPILRDLLEDEFLVPLAADWRTLGRDPQHVRPHLGPRARAAWDRGWPPPQAA